LVNSWKLPSIRSLTPFNQLSNPTELTNAGCAISVSKPDYGEFSLVDEGEAQASLGDAAAFVNIVEQYLHARQGES